MSSITVDSTAALNSALKSVHDGDTILLKAGTYDGVSMNNLSFANGITITSADPQHAVLTNFDMHNDHGVTLSNLEMAAKGPAYYAFIVDGSSNLHLDHISVHGSLDGNAQNDVEGVSILGGSNITITNSEFQQLQRGLGISASSNVTIWNNNFHDVQTTGLVMAAVSNVQISGNAFSNFHPLPGDHPDAIQFETAGTTAISSNISITDNAIYRGTGDGTQGIFFRDQVGTMHYQNVTIANNLVDGTGYGGIYVDGLGSGTISNNQLVSLPGDTNKTVIVVENSANTAVTGNQAISIGFSNNVNVTQSGNTITQAVTDGGAAALQTWLAAHPIGNAPPTMPLATPGVSLLGTFGNDLLIGMGGNDTLDGQGGADTLSGGAGDDTYLLPNPGVSIVESVGGGNDTVIAKGSYTLAANVENLVINSVVTNDWDGTGNALNNQITGNAGANSLDGGAGNDTIAGGAGNDTIFGGLGADRLTGGAGGDVFRFAPGGGQDVITDYGVGTDKIDISGYLKAGLTATLRDVGADLVISYANGDTITVLGHHAADMHLWNYGWSI